MSNQIIGVQPLEEEKCENCIQWREILAEESKLLSEYKMFYRTEHSVRVKKESEIQYWKNKYNDLKERTNGK